MSLLDNVRHSLDEAAKAAREVGQNLSAQAQSQLNIKKQEFEHSKKLRDLGEKTFAWYQTGQMVVTGQVPADVQQLCREVDESSTRLRAEEARLEDWKQQAALRGQNRDDAPSTFTVLPNATAADATAANAANDNLTRNDMSHNHTTHGGVTMPGTEIVTNPTTTNTNSDANMSANATPISPSHENAPQNAPAPAPPKTLGDDAPIVPVSDLAPSPSGEVAIGGENLLGGGTVPGAPGTSDTMGHGNIGLSGGGTM